MKRFSMAMTWLALAGLMTTVSCRKPVVGFTNGESRTVTVSAVTESGGGSKTSIDGLNVNWSENDQISMNGCVLELKEGAGTTKGVFEGTVTGTGPYYVGYPAEYISYVAAPLSFSINIPASWTYDVAKQIVPMVAVTNSVEGGLQFHNAVNMLKLQLNGGGDDDNANKLKRIVITSTTSNLSGKISVTFDEGGNPTFNAIAGEGASKTMTVNFSNGGLQLGETVQCVYIPLAKIAADEVLTVRFICAAGEMKKKVTATSSFNAVNNMLDGDVVEVKAVPVFSVSATTTVEFAPGNLQYLGQAAEGHKWRFAEHQWDYMGAGPSATSNRGNVDLGTEYTGRYNTGSGNAGGSETEADKKAARDLFGWGCTGYQDERKKSHTKWYQTNYQPYSTSSKEPNTSYNRSGYGPDYVSSPYYNLTVADMSDWGCLEIGTYPAETWRTLSSTEWGYLFNTRTVNGGKGEGKSYQRATINSDASDGSKVYGMLLYPDGYTAQTGAKSYTTAQWSAMESAGVVFLPAAGGRSGTSPSDVGPYGYYWSSSCSSYQAAYSVHFYNTLVSPQNSNKRYLGYSVRLVR